MSASPGILKRPKVEDEESGEGKPSLEEQEQAVVALISHRTNEVEHLRQRISYYTNQLKEAEKRLRDSEALLVRLQGQKDAAMSSDSLTNVPKNVKVESQSTSPVQTSGALPQPETKLHKPYANPKLSVAKTTLGTHPKITIGSGVEANPSDFLPYPAKVKKEKSSSDVEVIEVKDRGTKRKLEKKEHTDLIPLIRTSSSPQIIRHHTSTHISSQHKRKLRSLALCPVNDQLFVSSALDGMVNLWQIQCRGSGASLLSSSDCASPVQRRWPEDIAWHPQGNSLFSAYTADAGDSQISVLNLNKSEGTARVTFLEGKPHVKGIINSIVFMPWENTCFITGGSDHAVVLWSEGDVEIAWKPKQLHRNMHSSAVMGVAGLQQKKIILSAGADKRIIGFDAHVGRADFNHQIESKCMSVLPNPCDFNLFMVQAGAHEKQFRLFDIRLRKTELHAFGFKQESSESHSALINPAWSPDGLYLTSGSADPVIHIFDIRYNARKPSQSIRAHQKRVFKAEWHYSLPLLISISSDLNIGLHKI